MRKAKALFLDLVGRSPAERERILTARNSLDPLLRRFVRDLLHHHDRGTLDAPLQQLEDFETFLHRELEGLPLFGVPQAIGAYTILGEIGRGGMGVVFRARHAAHERDVALKVLASRIDSAATLRRFRRESEALRHLDHPGTVRLLDTGIWEDADGKRPYLVMELVEGETLLDYVRSRNLRPVYRLTLLAEICDIVHHAHTRGIVHRDLKPENILVEPSGQPRILDFGVARIHDVTTSETTLTNQLLGTLHYMSPEQAASAPHQGPASDQYALGVIAYEVMTGSLPYTLPEAPLDAVLERIRQVPMRPLHSAGVPNTADLELALARALAKDPDERYGDVAAFGRDLRRAAAGVPVSVRRLRRARVLAQRVRRHLRGRLARAALLAVLVAGAFAAGAWYQEQRAQRDDARRWNAFVATMDRAAALFAPEQRGIERVQALLDLYHDAEQRLPDLASLPYHNHLRRFVAFRLATCYRLKADLTHDPEDYRMAVQYYEESSRIRTDKNTLTFMDKRLKLYPFLSGLQPGHALVGLGEAHAAWAEQADPLHHLRRAVQAERAAIDRFAADKGYVHASALDVPTTHFVYGEFLNALGSSLARLGWVADSLAAVDEGLACLHRATRVGDIPNLKPQYGSILHRLGQAYGYRAALTCDPADFDSSEAFFARALDIRTLAARPLPHLNTLAARARARCVRAECAEAHGAARDASPPAGASSSPAGRWWLAAVDDIAGARRVPESAGPLVIARLDGLEAAAWERSASLRRIAHAVLDAAPPVAPSLPPDSLWARALGTFRAHRALPDEAETLVWQARALRARGNERAAERRLREAERLFTPQEFPRLHAEIAALRGAGAAPSAIRTRAQ